MTRNWLEKVDDGRRNFRTYKKQFLAAAYCSTLDRKNPIVLHATLTRNSIDDNKNYPTAEKCIIVCNKFFDENSECEQTDVRPDANLLMFSNTEKGI